MRGLEVTDMAARARHLRIVVRQAYKYRGDPSWHVVKLHPRRPGQKQGKREIVPEPFEDRARAEQLAHIMRKRLAVQTDERLTIADLISHYLQHAKQRDRRPLGPGTYTLQLGYLENHIGPSEFGQRLPEQLEDGDLRRFMEKVRSRLAPASTIGCRYIFPCCLSQGRSKDRVMDLDGISCRCIDSAWSNIKKVELR